MRNDATQFSILDVIAIISGIALMSALCWFFVS